MPAARRRPARERMALLLIRADARKAEVCFAPDSGHPGSGRNVRFVPISLRKSVTTAARVANEGF